MSKSTRYAERHRALGLCAKCPLPVAVSGKTGEPTVYCAAHLVKAAARRRRHRIARPDMKRGAEWRYQQRHRAAGLCISCARPVAVSEKTLEDSIRCEVHQDRQADADARHRARKKGRGLCREN